MKLSIITINYNNSCGLQKTIDSVVTQSWHEFEWIIIDGGSTDGSKEFIEKHQGYFTYWCSEPDKGVYHAMNKGVAKAKGDYLLFLNSGDCLHDIKVLENMSRKWGEADIIYGDICFEKKDGRVVYNYPDKLTTHYLLSRSLGHPASFIKASLLKEKGYREDLRIISDWYSFVEWFRQGKIFCHIPLVIADFDTTGISSQNKELLHQEREILYKELFGKENLQWIAESIAFQQEKEKFSGSDVECFMRIKSRGGRKMKLLRDVLVLFDYFF